MRRIDSQVNGDVGYTNHEGNRLKLMGILDILTMRGIDSQGDGDVGYTNHEWNTLSS